MSHMIRRTAHHCRRHARFLSFGILLLCAAHVPGAPPVPPGPIEQLKMALVTNRDRARKDEPTRKEREKAIENAIAKSPIDTATALADALMLPEWQLADPDPVRGERELWIKLADRFRQSIVDVLDDNKSP